MDLRHYVRENQQVIDFVHHATPGVIDKYVGTLDYATARFNTILLKLSQDPLGSDKHSNEIKDCFEVIQKFHADTKRYLMWHYLFHCSELTMTNDEFSKCTLNSNLTV